METSISSVIMIALILISVLVLSHSFLSTQEALADSWREMELRIGEQAQTALLPVRATTGGAGDTVDVLLYNDGHTRLTDWSQWDVVVQYRTDSAWVVEWVPYIDAIDPGNGQWTEMGIYLDREGTVPEVYDPGILNPGEGVQIRLRLESPAALGTVNLVTVGTSNGISASTVFTR